MGYFAEIIGRVMMTAVRLPRSQKESKDELRYWAEVEYKRDKHYAVNCVMEGKQPYKT